MNQYTIVIQRPGTDQLAVVNITARNLGKAVRDAVKKVCELDGDMFATKSYSVALAMDGWPKIYTPQEAAEAAK